jgi:hypothetical protein
MIDEQWLSELRFEMPGVGTVTGLAGVGSQMVALTCIAEDGKETVLKSFRRALPWHLKEVPRNFGWTAGHSIDRLNTKLLSVAGSPIIDENCWTYNDLFNGVFRQLLKRSLTDWLREDASGDLPPLAYLVQTDVFARRMQDVLSSSSRADEYFGETFPPHNAHQLSSVLEDVGRRSSQPDMVALRDALAPHVVSRNPLFVWSAAVLEDMIEPYEFESAAQFVKANVPEMNDPINPLAMRGSDWLDVLFHYVYGDAETTTRLVDFAKHFGFIYEFDESDAPPSA